MITRDFTYVTEAFRDAGVAAAHVVGHEAVAQRWTVGSVLEGLSVGGLVSHLYAATQRTEAVLGEAPPEQGLRVGLTEFYGANRVNAPEELTRGAHVLVREDAERRAEEGYESVGGEFRDLVTRLTRRLPSEAADRLVPVLRVPGGVTPLITYLVTRVIELVVHADDVAVSVDLPTPAMSPQTNSLVLEAFMELARSRVGDLGVIRAFARRERADPDSLRVL